MGKTERALAMRLQKQYRRGQKREAGTIKIVSVSLVVLFVAGAIMGAM